MNLKVAEFRSIWRSTFSVYFHFQCSRTVFHSCSREAQTLYLTWQHLNPNSLQLLCRTIVLLCAPPPTKWTRAHFVVLPLLFRFRMFRFGRALLFLLSKTTLVLRLICPRCFWNSSCFLVRPIRHQIRTHSGTANHFKVCVVF